jgi:aldehyde dehydrogenase (NAD+)
MDVVNPATEESSRRWPRRQDDVDAAVQAARAALNGPWGKMSARERGRLVSKLADRLMERPTRCAARDAAQRQADLRVAADRDPGRAECFEYYAGGPTR